MNTTLNDSASRRLFVPVIASHAAQPYLPVVEPPDSFPVEVRQSPLAGAAKRRRLLRWITGPFVALGLCVLLFVVAYLTPGILVGVLEGAFGIPSSKTLFPLMLAGSAVGIVTGLLLLRWRLGKTWLADVGLNRLPLVPALLALACVPGLKILCGAISLLMTLLLAQNDPAVGFVTNTATSLPWWLSLLGIAVAPALIEELWFRGIIGRSMVSRYGAVVGILVASLLFGAFHLSLIQGTYAFALGIAAHLMYRATRSLWVPILVHFAFNAIAVGIVLLSQANGLETMTFEETSPAALVAILGVAAVSLLSFPFAVWGLYRVRDRQPEAAT